MHCVISWDIKADGQKWTEINNAMKEGLTAYSWVRALTTFYIVKVNSQNDSHHIHKKLATIAKTHPGKVNFVMSPLMQGGSYNGWLPKDLWPKIRKRIE